MTPFDSRADLHGQRSSTNAQAYVNEIWDRRDAEYAARGGKFKAEGEWPFVSKAHQESRVNVERLPAKIRSAVR
jgi:hypothetical protein